ncbi:Flp pilus assembly complex ATPase component TadA [Candidatus Kaiserbacteria bacterium]|nr:Flp pilus assembly complex ATPase component TadA [Candidatus Kaiserbacteria bacterium]
MDLLDHLLEIGEVSNSLVEEVRKIVSERGLSQEAALLELGVSPEKIREELAAYYSLPAFIPEEGFTIADDVLNYIPEDSAIHYKLVPLKVEDDVLLVGVNDPDNLQLREVLNFISAKNNLPFKMVFMLEADVKKAQKFYENLKGEVSDALVSLEDELEKKIAERGESENENNKVSPEHIKEDAPVTKIVATILRYAVDGRASDIHIEPTDSKVMVRFRVDGVLSKSLELPRNVHSAVVARIKILSTMRLDEKRRPQDGRFGANFDKRKIDFRVSVLPTNHGEKVVMRILDNEKGVSTLEETGINKHHLEAIRRMVKEPYGIILISGPTGSGKSTTLYAMLKEVDRAGKNVLSLEDPVEYNIDGVSQSQVRPEIGYTFANGLRAALRQDPDIIMVGEIRDKETAQLAIQAALTGHLVLSTIHTNNSIGVVPRLIDMGIDPYLIAPTLKLAIAQRLARRICGEGEEEPVSNSMKLMMEDAFKTLPEKYKNRIPEAKTVVNPKPSPSCATGMRGRVAIMEALEINERIQELILRNASEEEMFHEARSNGFMSMKEDAIIKALNHVIPYQEMNTFGSKVGIEETFDELEEIEVASKQPVDNSQ